MNKCMNKPNAFSLDLYVLIQKNVHIKWKKKVTEYLVKNDPIFDNYT